MVSTPAVSKYWSSILNDKPSSKASAYKAVNQLLLEVSIFPSLDFEMKAKSNFFRAAMKLYNKTDSLSDDQAFEIFDGCKDSPYLDDTDKAYADYFRALMRYYRRIGIHNLSNDGDFQIFNKCMNDTKLPDDIRSKSRNYRVIL